LRLCYSKRKGEHKNDLGQYFSSHYFFFRVKNRYAMTDRFKVN